MYMDSLTSPSSLPYPQMNNTPLNAYIPLAYPCDVDMLSPEIICGRIAPQAEANTVSKPKNKYF
jgi:hypothetical protein